MSSCLVPGTVLGPEVIERKDADPALNLGEQSRKQIF